MCYLAGEFASMLIKKLRKREGIQKEDEVHILCIQIAGLCHDLGKYMAVHRMPLLSSD